MTSDQSSISQVRILLCMSANQEISKNLKLQAKRVLTAFEICYTLQTPVISYLHKHKYQKKENTEILET